MKLRRSKAARLSKVEIHALGWELDRSDEARDFNAAALEAGRWNSSETPFLVGSGGVYTWGLIGLSDDGGVVEGGLRAELSRQLRGKGGIGLERDRAWQILESWVV